MRIRLPALSADESSIAGDEEASGRGAVFLPVRPVLGQAAVLWLATRVAYAVLTFFAVPLSAQPVHGPVNHTHFPPDALLAHWWHWDAQWYTGIATDGYHDVQTTAFFPLYPLLIHVVSVVAGMSHVIGVAFVLSNLATLGAFIALGLLAANEYGADASRSAIRALAAFPLAFFLTAGYSDSLFIALATFCLLCARRRLWLWAAVCAFLATLTRLFGLVLVLPLLWEYGGYYRETHGLSVRRSSIRSLAGGIVLAVASPLAVGVYALYLSGQRGDALSFVHAERTYWGHIAVGPWTWIDTLFNRWQNLPGWTYPEVRTLFDVLPVLAFIILTLIAIRKLPWSLWLYSAGTIGVCLTTLIPANFDPFVSQGRYVMAAVPLFLLLGRWMMRRPDLDLLIVGGGFLLQGVFATIFLRGGWLI